MNAPRPPALERACFALYRALRRWYPPTAAEIAHWATSTPVFERIEAVRLQSVLLTGPEGATRTRRLEVLLQSLNPLNLDRGLDVSGVLVVRVALTGSIYETPASRGDASRAIAEAARTLPGIRHVAWSYGTPRLGGVSYRGTWSPMGPARRLASERRQSRRSRTPSGCSTRAATRL